MDLHLEEFSNSRQRGLFHALKGRAYATEWMRQRGLYGFDEWHSNSYYPASMLPLFNIYEFAPYEDHKLRLLAGPCWTICSSTWRPIPTRAFSALRMGALTSPA